jgi:hypothetical protein
VDLAVGVDATDDFVNLIGHARLALLFAGLGRHHRPGRAAKTSTGNSQAPNEVTFRPTGWCAFDALPDRPTDP